MYVLLVKMLTLLPSADSVGTMIPLRILLHLGATYCSISPPLISIFSIPELAFSAWPLASLCHTSLRPLLACLVNSLRNVAV